MKLLGLRTIIYSTSDLVASRAWFAGLLATEPYFDEPYYVGFSIGGYELGLMPASADRLTGTSTTYWGVPDADAALRALEQAGARPREPVTDVGGDIRVASVLTPDGHVIGVIENPHFEVEPVTHQEGPGR